MAPYVVFSQARRAGYSDTEARQLAGSLRHPPLPLITLVQHTLLAITGGGIITGVIVAVFQVMQ